MSYSIQCKCKRVIHVRAAQAGTSVPCACGATVEVPTVSGLRKAAGEEAIPMSTIGRIRAMITQGELPTGEICPISGRPVDDVVFLRVQCERTWVHGRDSLGWIDLLACLVSGWLLVYAALLGSPPPEVMGRDTVIDVPLRISKESRRRLLKTRRQRKLRLLLESIPVYCELLSEFPEAMIVPVPTTSAE